MALRVSFNQWRWFNSMASSISFIFKHNTPTSQSSVSFTPKTIPNPFALQSPKLPFLLFFTPPPQKNFIAQIHLILSLPFSLCLELPA